MSQENASEQDSVDRSNYDLEHLETVIGEVFAELDESIAESEKALAEADAVLHLSSKA